MPISTAITPGKSRKLASNFTPASRSGAWDDRTRSLPSGDRIDARVTTRIDVSDFVDRKIRATAAHRSQYPIDPTMFPESILREMFGVEYFIQVLPERELKSSLFED